jgi:tetratricopeptide (TPR) repeat protein
MRIRISFLTAAFLCGAAGASELRFAESAAARMTTDDQIAVYQKWLASGPANRSNQTLLAAAYIQKTRETYDFGYLNRAQTLIDRVLIEQKDNYEALRLRNLVELNLHHFANVADYSRQLTRSAPRDPQNWGTLGDALMEMGDYAGAADAYHTMMSLRPNLFSYNRMAYYRFVTGDADGAISIMEKAVASESSYPENKAWCQTELGNLYFKTGRLAEAERAYRSATDTFPRLHAAHAGLGNVLSARDEIEAAIVSYQKAQALVPMPQYAASLSYLYEAAGMKVEARKQRELIDLTYKMEQAASQKANRTLALLYADQNRNLDRALELARADLEIRRDVYTWDVMAWVLYKNQKYAEAVEAAQNALAMGTQEPMFYYHAAMIEKAAGMREQAGIHLEKALALNPKFDPGQSRIAEALRRELANGGADRF